MPSALFEQTGLSTETDPDAALRMMELVFPDKSAQITLWLKSAEREHESVALFATVAEGHGRHCRAGLDGAVYGLGRFEGRGHQQVYVGPAALVEPNDDVYINGRVHRPRKRAHRTDLGGLGRPRCQAWRVRQPRRGICGWSGTSWTAWGCVRRSWSRRARVGSTCTGAWRSPSDRRRAKS